MQKKVQVGYDETKRMLNTLRRLNESRISYNTLSEQVQPTDVDPSATEPIKDDITVINDVDIKLASTDGADLKLMDDQKNTLSTLIDSFREQVSQIADLKPGFTLGEDQIRLDGSISDTGVNFVLIAGNEAGLYINADMLKLEDDSLLVLNKLFKFQPAFNDALNDMIRQRKTN
jgi:hypothetical protein